MVPRLPRRIPGGRDRAAVAEPVLGRDEADGSGSAASLSDILQLWGGSRAEPDGFG